MFLRNVGFNVLHGIISQKIEFITCNAFVYLMTLSHKRVLTYIKVRF
jgi:hypothetical protein